MLNEISYVISEYEKLGVEVISINEEEFKKQCVDKTLCIVTGSDKANELIKQDVNLNNITKIGFRTLSSFELEGKRYPAIHRIILT